MGREALAIRRKVFGDEHYKVAESLNNLAAALLDQVSDVVFKTFIIT